MSVREGLAFDRRARLTLPDAEKLRRSIEPKAAAMGLKVDIMHDTTIHASDDCFLLQLRCSRHRCKVGIDAACPEGVKEFPMARGKRT